MKVAVVRFPGSNADWDALHAVRHVLGVPAEAVFHKERSLAGFDAVVVPGGFSFGDYLRPGAIAGHSAISPALRRFADQGGPVLGICNGFQILCELGLLPGALVKNRHLRFECRWVTVAVQAQGWFTNAVAPGTRLRLPVAHADGCYFCDDATLAELEARKQVALRYVAQSEVAEPEAAESEAAAPKVAASKVAASAPALQTRPAPQSAPVSQSAPAAVDPLPDNPNGSRADIAGVYNEAGNVLGLMPHPERACQALLGGADGLQLLAPLAGARQARGGI